MLYALSCQIITSNDNIRKAVAQLIPDISDPRISDLGYQKGDIVFGNVNIFKSDIKLQLESDRDDITASVKGLAGVINSCETGSFIVEYKTWHDEDVPQQCELQTILEKN
jgi:hypothetical protein